MSRNEAADPGASRMTIKYFWLDPYLARHQTRVATVAGDKVSVESTIFFAFSGGQESDHGAIGGRPVLHAQRDGLELVYTLPEDHGLAPGQAVEIAIDWDRRYKLMRLHFAAELVLELFYRTLSGVGKVGAHVSPDKARIDFAWPESISPLLPEITSAANAIVESDLAISCAFEDERSERRYWEIDGFSRVPCGGTHVKRTGEIGAIRLKRNNIGRGKERVEIYLSS
jgi:Ser-tRNA(Ala) deacylase AlaX